MFKSFKEFGDAEENGNSRYGSFRKLPSGTSIVGSWFDLSMSPGNPVPNYYANAPLVAVALRQSTDGGLPHGADVGTSKYLSSITLVSATTTPLPLPIMVLDYLMYYPFIDEGVTDVQPMINNIALPRYSSGEGVKIISF